MQSVKMEIEVKVKGNEKSSGSIKVQENVSPICQPQPWESRFYHSAIYLMKAECWENDKFQDAKPFTQEI